MYLTTKRTNVLIRRLSERRLNSTKAELKGLNLLNLAGRDCKTYLQNTNSLLIKQIPAIISGTRYEIDADV